MFRQKDKRSIRNSTGKDVLFSKETSSLSLFLATSMAKSTGILVERNDVERYQLVLCVKSFTSYKIRKFEGIFDSSPTYDVSSYLAKILSPVVGNTVNTQKFPRICGFYKNNLVTYNTSLFNSHLELLPYNILYIHVTHPGTCS